MMTFLVGSNFFMMIMKTLYIYIVTLLIFTATFATANTQSTWRSISDGLEFARFRSSLYPNDTNAVINILRINTNLYELHLFNASNTRLPNNDTTLAVFTARQWAQREGLAAVINAAMYQPDFKTSVSYMRTSRHVNNSHFSQDKTILVFEPQRAGVPSVRIVDTDCDDFQTVRRDYGSAVQSIRMISCDGQRNVWRENNRRWSIAAVGIDKSGSLLFIQSTAIHSVHEFINILLELPINIDRAMYMEGGSPSQMFIDRPQSAGGPLEFYGNYTAGGRPHMPSSIPNVLGIKRR